VASTTEVVISLEDLVKAYFLHPSNHPSLLLVSTTFDGTGFGYWKIATTTALSMKSKLYFIDESLAKPPPKSPNFKKVMKCNDMLMFWILNVSTKTIANGIIYVKFARQIWAELEKIWPNQWCKLYQVQKEMCNVG